MRKDNHQMMQNTSIKIRYLTLEEINRKFTLYLRNKKIEEKKVDKSVKQMFLLMYITILCSLITKQSTNLQKCLPFTHRVFVFFLIWSVAMVTVLKYLTKI